MTTNNATQAPGINTSYLIESENEQQSYPALQADIYQPRSSTEEISIGIAEDSFHLLPEEEQAKLNPRGRSISYGNNEVLLYIPQAEFRVVILGKPELFVVDKESGDYSFLRKGMKLAGTKKVTIAKLFLLLLVEDQFIRNGEGTPQVFTLNLKSSKTSLLGNAKSQPGDGTIASLNNGLRKHYKTGKGWLVHLVSVKLIARPKRYTSSLSTKDSSLGIEFLFDGGAIAMSEENQKTVFDLLQDETLRQVISDPFNLSGQASDSGTEKEQQENEDQMSFDDIPF